MTAAEKTRTEIKVIPAPTNPLPIRLPKDALINILTDIVKELVLPKSGISNTAHVKSILPTRITAASLNVVHERIVLTDRVCSRIKGDEVQAEVIDLANRSPENLMINENNEWIRRFLDWESHQGE